MEINVDLQEIQGEQFLTYRRLFQKGDEKSIIYLHAKSLGKVNNVYRGGLNK